MLDLDLQKVLFATNQIADEIRTIRERMVGKGINPAEAPLIIEHLGEMERKLRMIAADKNNIVPFLNK